MSKVLEQGVLVIRIFAFLASAQAFLRVKQLCKQTSTRDCEDAWDLLLRQDFPKASLVAPAPPAPSSRVVEKVLTKLFSCLLAFSLFSFFNFLRGF